ncbi:MAG: hypothetical protein HOM30_02445 [Gammaproteobacteria bacterium]|nr:hypothetical protein [Gammaproteobacteria bacterium]
MVNEFITLTTYAYSIHYYIFELANYSVLVFLVVLFRHFGYLNNSSFWTWCVLLFTPLLVNNLLFDSTYYSDQHLYTMAAIDQLLPYDLPGKIINTFDTSWVLTTNFTSALLNLVPIPMLMTYTSLAFANKFFALILFVWLTKFIDQDRLIIFFLVPSLILYSSLTLRDPMIIALSCVYLIHLINHKYLLAMIFLAPLILLKVQNFSFLIVAFIAMVFFQVHKSKLGLIIFFITAIIGSLIFQERLLDGLNIYRIAFAMEDSVYGYEFYNEFNDSSLLEINSIFSLIFISIKDFPNFMLMPLPWNWSNAFHVIQFLEGLLLLIAMISIIKKFQLHKTLSFYPLLISLLLGLFVYTVIAFNEGTFVRYRFTFFFPFLLAFYYLGLKTSDQKKIK